MTNGTMMEKNHTTCDSPTLSSLKSKRVDVNLFVQALVLSPSAWPGCWALLISMRPGRQRSALHSLSYLSAPTLCILRVSPRYHPAAEHRCMSAHILDLLPLRFLTGEWPWKQRIKILWRTWPGCVGLQGSHVMVAHQHSPRWPKQCWQMRKSRGARSQLRERESEGPVRLCTTHKSECDVC